MYLYHVLFVLMNICGIDCQKKTGGSHRCTPHHPSLSFLGPLGFGCLFHLLENAALFLRLAYILSSLRTLFMYTSSYPFVEQGFIGIASRCYMDCAIKMINF
jgi:hypothetical protein